MESASNPQPTFKLAALQSQRLASLLRSGFISAPHWQASFIVSRITMLDVAGAGNNASSIAAACFSHSSKRLVVSSASTISS